MDINYIINIVIQVLFIFIFLTIFFFTYASKKEADVVQNQVNFFIDNLFGHNLNLLDPSIKESLKTYISSIKIDTPENKVIKENIDTNNKSIIKKSIKILSIAFGITLFALLISIYLSKQNIPFFQNINFKKIGIESIVIISAVALTEFIFFTFFASRYISIKPNIIKAELVKNLNLAI